MVVEIVARVRLHRLNPSMALRCRSVSYQYRCHELLSLTPQVHDEVYYHAMTGLYDTAVLLAPSIASDTALLGATRPRSFLSVPTSLALTRRTIRHCRRTAASRLCCFMSLFVLPTETT